MWCAGLAAATIDVDVAVTSNTVSNTRIEIKEASSAILATVTTDSITNIGRLDADGGGNVTSDGGASVTARGVCWDTTTTPDINDSTTSNGTGTGTFTSDISGLSPNILYYVRAYDTNSVGTACGGQVSFTTKRRIIIT